MDGDSNLVDVAKGLLDYPLSENVKTEILDPYSFVKENKDRRWELIILDYWWPDPELITVEHMIYVGSCLTRNGIMAVHTISPFANPRAASCALSTVSKAFEGYNVLPYKVHLPYRGAPSQEGFIVASPWPMQLHLPVDKTKYLTPATVGSAFIIDKDEVYVQMPESTMKNLLYNQLVTAPFARDEQ